MFRWPTIALMVLSAAISAFAQQKAAESPAKAQTAAYAPAPAAKSLVSDLVVARVSGEPITETQVLSNIEVLSGQTLLKPEEMKNRNNLYFKGAMDNLIAVAVLKLEARRLNLTVDSAKLDQQVQQYASRYPSKEAFQKAMVAQGVTEAEFRSTIESNLLIQQLLDQAVKNVPPTSDADIQKFYDSNPEKFPIPERAHMAQVFLKAGSSATPEQKAEIRKKLESIRTDIGLKKITFEEAATKFSQDTASAQKSGDLGFVTRGQMGKHIEEAVFKTMPGDITPVIESETGYHLIRVIEQKAAGKATLDEVKPAIKNYLDQVARQSARQAYMKDLESKAVVETFMTPEEFSKRHPVP
jgi:peptidyl-prolyl cis-trans isomerase C